MFAHRVKPSAITFVANPWPLPPTPMPTSLFTETLRRAANPPLKQRASLHRFPGCAMLPSCPSRVRQGAEMTSGNQQDNKQDHHRVISQLLTAATRPDRGERITSGFFLSLTYPASLNGLPVELTNTVCLGEPSFEQAESGSTNDWTAGS